MEHLVDKVCPYIFLVLLTDNHKSEAGGSLRQSLLLAGIFPVDLDEQSELHSCSQAQILIDLAVGRDLKER